MSDASDPRIEIAEHLYEAIAAGDVDEVVSWAHPEIVLDWTRSRGPYHGTYEGHEGAQTLIEEVVTAFRGVEFFTEEWIPVGDRLVRVGGIRGVGRGSGVEISGSGAHVFEFVDGFVKRVTLFQGKDEALAAAAAAN